MKSDLQSRPYTAWQLIRAYWQSEQALFASSFFVFVILISGAIIGLDVVFNYWYNHFYDALQDYDKRGAIDLIAVFAFLAGGYIVLQVYRYYIQQYLCLRWRKWLTYQFLHRWLDNKSYYYLEQFDNVTDNPDQRIQEDIGSLVASSLDLSLGLFTSVVTFFAFIYILWTLSGPLKFHIGHYPIVVPGYLVWVSIIYALFGTYFAFRIGFPLVSLNFEQQRREANFRFSAVDLRSHAEHVALYRGESHERSSLGRLFDRVLENWYAIILRQKLLLWFTAGYNQVSVLVPLLVALPNYFGKIFKLGGFMQALRAFQQIQDSLSFLVNSYSQIAAWRAVVRRLLTFLNHMDEVEKQVSSHNRFVFNVDGSNDITVNHLTLLTPQGEVLLKDVDHAFQHGKNYLIKGESGLGKSTLIRAIAGIWPYGSGEIYLPPNKKIMYIPQRSYMPLGTLKDALLFPEMSAKVSEEILIQTLLDCDLPQLTTRLHEVAMWSQQLSPGELQRVAFARILLQKPYWVFIDEGTSALDLAHEEQLYQLIKTKLPTCSVISVGHQPSVEVFHDYQWDLSRYAPDKATV